MVHRATAAAVAIGFVDPSRRTLIALAVEPPSLYMPSAVLYASSQQRLRLLAYFPAWMAVSALLGAIALTCEVSTRWKTLTAQERGETRPGWYAPRTGEVGVVVLGFVVAAVAPFLLGIWLFNRRIDAALDAAAHASLGESLGRRVAAMTG